MYYLLSRHIRDNVAHCVFYSANINEAINWLDKEREDDTNKDWEYKIVFWGFAGDTPF